MNPLIKAAIIGAVSALVIDLQAFVLARSKNKRARFDFALCAARVVLGAATGALGGQVMVIE